MRMSRISWPVGVPPQRAKQRYVDTFQRELVSTQPHRFRVALVMPGSIAGSDANGSPINALFGKARIIAVALGRVHALV